jgi:hypothetical protein
MANPIEIFQTKVTTAADALALINGVFQWAFGPNEPSVTFPFLNWADTVNDLWKQRNADDNGWVIRGALSQAYFGLASADLVDPLGHVKEYYGSTLPPRHLWVDGKTIGDESSNATGRANADVYNLFALLWGSIDNISSQIKLYNSAGAISDKGISAASDFAAHKKISLPDRRDNFARGIPESGRVVGSYQADAGRNITGSLGTIGILTTTNPSGPFFAGSSVATVGSTGGTQLRPTDFDASRVWTATHTDSEFRPVNVACNYIMRY